MPLRSSLRAHVPNVLPRAPAPTGGLSEGWVSAYVYTVPPALRRPSRIGPRVAIDPGVDKPNPLVHR